MRSKISFAVITVFSTTVYANDQLTIDAAAESPNAIELNKIVIEAENEISVGTTVYTKEQLENMPNGKKTISEFLRTNPNVQFARDSLNAGNQASLAPEKISINGAKFYDNKFVVNGVNTSNNFDPVGETADASINGVPSHSQTANINTDLLCELEVIDSNASAEHGDFQGGVISAKTCAPTTQIGKIHGSISADYTTSAWSRFNFIDEYEELDADKIESVSSNQYHREYDTYGISSTLYGNINEKWGISLNTGLRNSTIPILSGYSLEKVNTHENNNSYGLTAFYTPNNQNKYKFGIDHFDYNREGFFSKIINSDYTIATQTTNFFLQSEHLFDKFKIENNLNYRTSDQQREHAQNYSAIWAYSEGDKDWLPETKRGETTFSSGGVGGSINAQQNTLSYDFKLNLNPFKTGNLGHSIRFGAGYKHNEANWDRFAEHAAYGNNNSFEKIKRPNGSNSTTDDLTKPILGNLGYASCALGDHLCSETDLEITYKVNGITQGYYDYNGQFLRTGTISQAGKVKARQDQWSTFLEDEINWNNVKVRLGARADYDSLASNLNIAPRSNIEYRPFNNPSLRLTSGFNRYYGVTYLFTEINDKVSALNQKVERANEYNSNWNASNNYGWTAVGNSTQSSGTKATDLNTPYNDEMMLTIDGEISNLHWGLKWVNRDFKDAIRKNQKLNSYENIDAGKANTYTLTLKNLTPYQIWNTHHNLSLGLSYIEDETYQPTYRSNDSTNNDKWAWVDGEVYQVGNIPTKDSPFTARLNWLVQSPNSNWALNNFLNYRSGSTNYVATKEQIDLDDSTTATIYEKRDFASKFTWDTRATYNWKVKQDQHLVFGLTISNLLNKKNQSVTTTNKVYSEEGRRFIADVSYKF